MFFFFASIIHPFADRQEEENFPWYDRVPDHIFLFFAIYIYYTYYTQLRSVKRTFIGWQKKRYLFVSNLNLGR